jgi:hypothetical protein
MIAGALIGGHNSIYCDRRHVGHCIAASSPAYSPRLWPQGRAPGFFAVQQVPPQLSSRNGPIHRLLDVSGGRPAGVPRHSQRPMRMGFLNSSIWVVRASQCFSVIWAASLSVLASGRSPPTVPGASEMSKAGVGRWRLKDDMLLSNGSAHHRRHVGGHNLVAKMNRAALRAHDGTFKSPVHSS